MGYRGGHPHSRYYQTKPAGAPRVANTQHKPKLFHAAIGSLLARYVRFVGRTSRQTEAMTERFDRHSHNHPCIVTMWHGQFMLLPLIKKPDFEADVMLARHSDAELMGAVLRHFDIKLIRGAGAGSRGKDRGGSHAYRAAVQTLREGRTIAMTADVPGGEARRAGLGVVMIARQTGRPILPMAIATSRYIAFNSWSRMTVNLPWSDLGFAIGAPVDVPRTADPDNLEVYRKAVEDSLNAATALAYKRANADPTRATPEHGIDRARRARPASEGVPDADISRTPGGPAAAQAARASRQRGSGAAPGTPRPAQHAQAAGNARLVPRSQRRRDQRHPAADDGAVQAATGAVLPAHDRHRDIGETGCRASGTPRHASVCAARCSRVRAQFPRSLAAGPRRLHRVRDLAEPHPREFCPRHPAGADQCPHDQAIVPALAAQPGRRKTAVQPLLAGADAERYAHAPLQDAGSHECVCGGQSQSRHAAASRSTWPNWSA